MFDQPLQCHCHVALTCSADAMPNNDMFSVTCSSHSMFIVPCNCSPIDGCSLLMADCALSSTSGSLHCELVLDINGTFTCSLLEMGMAQLLQLPVIVHLIYEVLTVCLLDA